MITLEFAHVMVLCYGMLLPHHPLFNIWDFFEKSLQDWRNFCTFAMSNERGGDTAY